MKRVLYPISVIKLTKEDTVALARNSLFGMHRFLLRVSPRLEIADTLRTIRANGAGATR